MSDKSPVEKSPEVLALEAQLESMKKEMAVQMALLQAKLDAPIKLTLKVSEKGALSLYGMGRFPVTLYREQWETVLKAGPEITAFIKAHDKSLKLKGDETDEEVKARRERVAVETRRRQAEVNAAAAAKEQANAPKAVPVLVRPAAT